MKMILWTMQNINPKDVPSYKSLRDEQARLKTLCGVPTLQYKSQQGDIYYLNDVVDIMKKVCAALELNTIEYSAFVLITQNLENPETAQHIMYYPEDTDGGPRSEFTQFSRLREHPDQLTPSFRMNNKRFYTNELAMLRDGRMVIPLIWVNVKGEVHAYCKLVTLEATGLAVGDTEHRIPAKDLVMNFPEIVAETGVPQFKGLSTCIMLAVDFLMISQHVLLHLLLRCLTSTESLIRMKIMLFFGCRFGLMMFLVLGQSNIRNMSMCTCVTAVSQESSSSKNIMSTLWDRLHKFRPPRC